MISVNTFRSLHKLLHPHVSVHSGIPPVLTGGLLVFMVLFCATTYILPSPLESLSLSAATVKNFEPNRLTWYPLLHYNIFHLILCSYLLYPMLAAFEKFNGTVRTAIVLNALATVAGVMYILSQLAMFSDSSVIGSSVWVFSLYAYFAYKESLKTPTVYVSASLTFPTWGSPILPFIIVSVVFPGPSFFIHLFALVAGYLLAMDYLKFMTDPSSKVVQYIEGKLDGVIDLIPPKIRYIKEADAIEIRREVVSASLPLYDLPRPETEG